MVVVSRASSGLWCSEEELGVSLIADSLGRLQAISRGLRCKWYCLRLCPHAIWQWGPWASRVLSVATDEAREKELSVVRQGVVSNKLCTHQVLGTLAWWTYICLIHRSCVAAHSKIESALVLTDGTLAFFFFQHNVFTHYKPSNTNILLDALSRRSSVRVETPGSR